MAAAGNLTLKNYADVNVTYYPLRIETGKQAVYVDRTNSVLAAQSRASMFFSESPTTRKVSGKVTFPVLNATTGVVSYTLLGTFDMRLPLTASLTERQELRKRLASAIADAIVVAAVDNGETPW